MTSWIRIHISLGGSDSGSRANSNIVNIKEVSCSIDFPKSKISKQKIETTYQIGTFHF